MLRSVLLTLLLPPVWPASPQQPQSWGFGTASSGSGRSDRDGRCLFKINSNIEEFSAGNHSCTLHVKDTARDTRRYFSFLCYLASRLAATRSCRDLTGQGVLSRQRVLKAANDLSGAVFTLSSERYQTLQVQDYSAFNYQKISFKMLRFITVTGVC